MKSSLQKLFALALALCLVFALAAAAAADDPLPALTVTNPTVTLRNIAEGDTVKAYRLISYADAGYNAYDYHADFGTYTDHFRGGDSRDVYLTTRLDDNGLANFLGTYGAAALAGYPGYTLPAAAASGTAGADGNAALTLEPGYYLLLAETTVENSRIYTPMSVFVRVKDGAVTVYGGGSRLADADPAMEAKYAEAPVVSKHVRDDSGVGADWKTTAAARTGETMDFYVRVQVPHYTGIHNLPTLTLTDTLDGLEYVAGSAAVYRAEGGNLFADEVTNAIKSETAGAYEGGRQTLTFALDYSEVCSDAGTVDVYIRYQAVVMPEAAAAKRTVDAAAGTSEQYAANSAVLTYATELEPEKTKTTLPSETKVYHYAFELKKYSTETDADGSPIPVAGAGFTVYTDAAHTQVLKMTLEAAGYYRPATDAEIAAGTAVEELTAPCTVRGLDVGTYHLAETTVPSGYYAPKAGFRLTLSAGRSAEALTGRLEYGPSSITTEDEADRLLVNGNSINALELNRFDFGLKNSSTPILPTTGGTGTALFTIGGVLLMAAAVWLFLVRRRRSGED